ncbi:hypothetical protein R3P38DRAFT_2981264 [Favolaschia claudopus]|uniref:DUF6533 domain-containing protein n=1 Tax=Favolaschia claudopus TaxID=2862362 RepID=A0AAW0B306_9AGAR
MLDETSVIASEIRTNDYLQVFSVAFMYWDWLITLDDEINFMWTRVPSASAFWFFAVRYLGILGNIPVTVSTFYSFPASSFVFLAVWDLVLTDWRIEMCCRCRAFHTAHQIVLVGTQLVVSLVMLVRVHALYGRSLRVLAAMLVAGFALLAVILWSAYMGQESFPVQGFPGCHTRSPQSSNYYLAGAWLALFAFDSLCFGLTLFKTYSTWRRTGSEANHLPIHALVLRDGAFYYAAMSLANFANLVTFYIAGPNLSGSLSTFASCISVTMMARLMLNLHQTSDASRGAANLTVDLDDCNSPVVFRRGGFWRDFAKEVNGRPSVPPRAVISNGSRESDERPGADVERQSLRERAW